MCRFNSDGGMTPCDLVPDLCIEVSTVYIVRRNNNKVLGTNPLGLRSTPATIGCKCRSWSRQNDDHAIEEAFQPKDLLSYLGDFSRRYLERPRMCKAKPCGSWRLLPIAILPNLACDRAIGDLNNAAPFTPVRSTGRIVCRRRQRYQLSTTSRSTRCPRTFQQGWRRWLWI
jgi:hypothetical protein